MEYYRKELRENKAHIPIWEQAIKGNREELKRMSAAQLKAPAHVYVYKDSYAVHPYNKLVPPTDKHGQELVTVNPSYFDKSLPKGTP